MADADDIETWEEFEKALASGSTIESIIYSSTGNYSPPDHSGVKGEVPPVSNIYQKAREGSGILQMMWNRQRFSPYSPSFDCDENELVVDNICVQPESILASQYIDLELIDELPNTPTFGFKSGNLVDSSLTSTLQDPVSSFGADCFSGDLDIVVKQILECATGGEHDRQNVPEGFIPTLHRLSKSDWEFCFQTSSVPATLGRGQLEAIADWLLGICATKSLATSVLLHVLPLLHSADARVYTGQPYLPGSGLRRIAETCMVICGFLKLSPGEFRKALRRMFKKKKKSKSAAVSDRVAHGGTERMGDSQTVESSGADVKKNGSSGVAEEPRSDQLQEEAVMALLAEVYFSSARGGSRLSTGVGILFN